MTNRKQSTVALLPVLLLLVCSTPFARAIIPSTTTQTTIPFNTSFKSSSSDLPYSDPLIAAPTKFDGIVAQQVHVTYITEDSVFITWITGNGSTYSGSTLPPANTVQDGRVTTALRLQPGNSMVNQTVFKSEPYYYIYETPETANVVGIQNYASGTVNTVLLSGLTPGETYTYDIIDVADNTNKPVRGNLNFTMPPPVGSPSMRFVLVGMVEGLYVCGADTCNLNITITQHQVTLVRPATHQTPSCTLPRKTRT